MSVEDQFDVAAQDRRAEAAKAARTAPPYVYDRDAVIRAAGAEVSTLGQAILDTPELLNAAAALEAEVPEVPGKVEQEPELQSPKARE